MQPHEQLIKELRDLGQFDAAEHAQKFYEKHNIVSFIVPKKPIDTALIEVNFANGSRHFQTINLSR